jgi:uncharacterized phage protein gp47/JayE
VAYKVPTLEQMLAFLLAMFKGQLPDRNVGSRFSPLWKVVKVIAGAATDVNANVDKGFQDAMPDTAKGAGLDRWIGIYKPGGTATRKAATPARKAGAGRVRGTAAATTSIGDQLIHRASGLLFQVNSLGTIPGVAPLQVDVDILALDKGAKTRLAKGEILEYLAAPAGIQTKVELQKDLDDDGVDAEQDGSARNRLLAAIGSPSSGGNQADYVGWALAQLGISQAFAYPNRAGLGTVDVAALHTGVGSARILNAGEMTTLLAALQALAPAQLASTGGALRVLTVIGGGTDAANLGNVEMTVTADGTPAFAFDWDDTTPPVVLAWTAGTRTLQFNAARPATMQAGHRIVLKGVVSSQDGAPVVIEALVSTDSVILQTIPKRVDGTDAAPAATDIVYAGGPLTDVVRPAIVAHLNGDVLYAAAAGPLPGAVAAATATSVAQLNVLATGIGTANPAGVYGAWVGGLLRANLAKIATYTRGVRNQTVITPAADQEAVDYAFPLDTQIGLLTSGYVLVRRG